MRIYSDRIVNFLSTCKIKATFSIKPLNRLSRLLSLAGKNTIVFRPSRCIGKLTGQAFGLITIVLNCSCVVLTVLYLYIFLEENKFQSPSRRGNRGNEIASADAFCHQHAYFRLFTEFVYSFVHLFIYLHIQMIKLTSARGSLLPRTNGQFLLDILASSPCISVNRSSKCRSSRISPRSLVVSPVTSLIFLSSRCQCEIHEKR